jgi:hypothetical protein
MKYVISLSTHAKNACTQTVSILDRPSFNPLNPYIVQILVNNSVRTSKKTPHFTITKINWLTLFKEIIAVYTENHTEPINIKYNYS